MMHGSTETATARSRSYAKSHRLAQRPPFECIALLLQGGGSLKAVGKPPIATERVVDTLVLARRKHPGGHNTLDDLCARYGVDRSRRTQHGALLDAEPIAAKPTDEMMTAAAVLRIFDMTEF